MVTDSHWTFVVLGWGEGGRSLPGPGSPGHLWPEALIRSLPRPPHYASPLRDQGPRLPFLASSSPHSVPCQFFP